MRKSIMTVVATLAMISSSAPVFAADAKSTTEASSPTKKKGKKVCRSDLTTGSRLKPRICMSEAQWNALNEEGTRDNNRALSNQRTRGDMQ